MKISIDSPKDRKNQAKVLGTLASIDKISSLCVPEISNTLKKGLPIFKKMKRIFNRSPKKIELLQEELTEVRTFLFKLSGDLTYAAMDECPVSSFALEEVHSLIELINYQENILAQHLKLDAMSKEVGKK